MVLLHLITTQKFYENPTKGVSYGFYWAYYFAPYWSMTEYEPRTKRLKERLLIKLKERAYSFVFLPPDTLITSGDSACHFYVFSKKGAVERGRLEGCNRKTWVYRETHGVRIMVPGERDVKIFKVKGLKAEPFAQEVYDHRIVDCWVYDTFRCAPDTGVFRGAASVIPLDVPKDLMLITYDWGIRIMRGKDTVVTVETPSRPLESSYSHGLLHVALGSHGLLTVDVNRGAYTYYRDIAAVNVYSSTYMFVVLVEDMDGCIHLFRPVFRPPSVAYIGKAETTFCR